MLSRRQIITGTAVIGAAPFMSEAELMAAEIPVADERDQELFHYVEMIRFLAEKMRRSLLQAEGASESARKELMLELRSSFMFLHMSAKRIDSTMEAHLDRYPYWPMPGNS